MMNLNRFLTAVVLTGSVALTTFVNAEPEEYYTWVDENGVTNYAERNPEGIDATFVGRSRAFGRPGAPAESGPFDRPAEQPASSEPSEIDPDALVDENAAALAAELAETKRRNCEIGKNNLAQLKAFARIRVSDEKGENRILTDEEKAAKTEQARQVIRDNCSG
ncbi:MAG: hypothetical protein ACE37D_11460 [Pseudomonadales bacterium]